MEEILTRIYFVLWIFQGNLSVKGIQVYYIIFQKKKKNNYNLREKYFKHRIIFYSGSAVGKIENGRFILYGIVSFTSSRGCKLGYPTGFTEIQPHLDWIMKNI